MIIFHIYLILLSIVTYILYFEFDALAVFIYRPRSMSSPHISYCGSAEVNPDYFIDKVICINIIIFLVGGIIILLY